MMNNLGKNIIYFDGWNWSKGNICEINPLGIKVVDLFTYRWTIFKPNSTALIPNIHPCESRRLNCNNKTERLISTKSFDLSSYKDPEWVNDSNRMKDYVKSLCIDMPDYVINSSKPMEKEHMIIGKEVKLYIGYETSNLFLKWRQKYTINDKQVTIHNISKSTVHNVYTYGYIHGIGNGYVTVIVQMRNSVYILVIPNKHLDQIYERCEEDYELKISTPVKFRDVSAIIVDVTGDMVKLSNMSHYVDKKDVKINLYKWSFDELCNTNPCTHSLGDDMD